MLSKGRIRGARMPENNQKHLSTILAIKTFISSYFSEHNNKNHDYVSTCPLCWTGGGLETDADCVLWPSDTSAVICGVILTAVSLPLYCHTYHMQLLIYSLSFRSAFPAHWQIWFSQFHFFQPPMNLNFNPGIANWTTVPKYLSQRSFYYTVIVHANE